MPLQLRPQLAREEPELLGRIPSGRAIHGDGMPLRRGLAQLIVCGLVLTGAACRKHLPIPDGDIAATLTAKTLADQPFDPASLRGKPTIVVFAWPTCPHCIKEIPIAQQVAASERAGMVVVFVRGSRQAAGEIVAELKLTAPVLVDDGTLRNRYAVNAVPYTLVLGPDGHATDVFRGAQDEATLRSALADAR